MATKRSASGVDSLTDQDKVTRRIAHIMNPSTSPALAAGDVWDLGPVSTARGTDGIYLVRYGNALAIFVLNNTTVTAFGAPGAALAFSGTVNTTAVITVTGNRLVITQYVTAGSAAGAITITRLAV